MQVTMILEFPASYCHFARRITEVYLLYCLIWGYEQNEHFHAFSQDVLNRVIGPAGGTQIQCGQVCCSSLKPLPKGSHIYYF